MQHAGSIASSDITGLVLAGGHGSRMGGVDKGLQALQGRPLALHALLRLRPQVGPLAINANRNHASYAAFGVPVWPDTLGGQPGPLAGLLAGVSHCTTPWLACVPCDTPHFPADLVARLARAVLLHGAELAVAATRDGVGGATQAQPVFCLLHRSLAGSLADFLGSGQHKVDAWAARHRRIDVVFDETAAFFNVNTADELGRLQQQP